MTRSPLALRIILFCLVLAGCTPQSPNPPVTGTGTDILAKEGEFCGGIAGIICDEGLDCKYEGTYPDAGGTCVEK